MRCRGLHGLAVSVLASMLASTSLAGALPAVAATKAAASPSADCPVTCAGFGKDSVGVKGSTRTDSGTSNREPVGSSGPSVVPTVDVVWLLGCPTNDPNLGGGDDNCTTASTFCPPGEVLYWRWIRPLSPPGRAWVQAGERCSVGPPAPQAAAMPVVTPGMVLAAFRRLPLPKAPTLVQPADRTLVNFDTIFYTRVRVGDMPVTLLGQRVVVRPKPQSYLFDFGDGASFGPTTNPGAPYPRKDITHVYPHTGAVTASVAVTYSAQFSVGGGPWQDVPGTVTVDGPQRAVRIVAARSELIAGDG
jgi:hypothetical protein